VRKKKAKVSNSWPFYWIEEHFAKQIGKEYALILNEDPSHPAIKRLCM